MTRPPDKRLSASAAGQAARDADYQRDAATVDRALSSYLQQALDADADPGAIVAGAVGAVVRAVFATMPEPRTVRGVMALVLPAVNMAAEAQLRALTRKCRVCGCTQDRGCVDAATGLTCAWAEADLCTACVPKN